MATCIKKKKKIISKRKSNRPRAALGLTRVEKGEVIIDNTVPKGYLPLFVENNFWDPQYKFGDQTEGRKK